MILDTTAVIDVMRGDTAVKEALHGTDGAAGITAPTLFELWSGVHQSDNAREEKQRVLEHVTAQRVVPFDEEVACLAGEIEASLLTDGVPIENIDCMIAATALEHDEALLTSDEHFARIDGLDVLSY